MTSHSRTQDYPLDQSQTRSGRTYVLQKRLGVVLWYGVMALFSAVALMPLFWMVTTSVKTSEEIYKFPPVLIPKTIRLANYVEAWTYEYANFPRWTLNTLFLTSTIIIAVLLSSSLCAYGFARIKFPGRRFWFMATLATTMLPSQVTLIPLYIMFHRIGWIDTYNPMIIPPWFGGGAVNIFLLRQFFMGIPAELEDAAVIDGAGRFQIWWRIFLPLSLPALTTIGIFTFQSTWSAYFGPLIYLNSPDKFTLALGLSLFNSAIGGRALPEQYAYIMAVSFLMTIPMIVIFFLAQRNYLKGMALAGIRK